MRTRKTTVTFRHPFTLKRDDEELPPGTYDIEIDEEEIQGAERSGYQQTAINFYVSTPSSTRAIILKPRDLESALERDRNAKGQGE